MTPNAPFIRQWAAALRSGLYLQGTGIHKDGDRYCALGVGYDLCPDAEWQEWRPGVFASRQFVAKGAQVAPDLLIATSGLSHDDLTYIAYHLNDGKRRSFAEIADYLESLIPVVTPVATLTREDSVSAGPESSRPQELLEA